MDSALNSFQSPLEFQPKKLESIIIGSRGSDLALWQANYISQLLNKQGIETSIKIIKTQGDKIQHLSLDKLDGKGFFTKELEEELLAGTIDLAVHSHKDLPTVSPKGLMIAAVSDRENPADIILINKNSIDKSKVWNLKLNSNFGSSSARRKAQLLATRPDLNLIDIRGNVPTRINKLRNGEFDAIMLAAAGLNRLKLDLSDFLVVEIDPEIFIPSPAQGVLALQINEENEDLFIELQSINNKKVQNEIFIERKVLNLFEGGCHMPLGVYCKTVEHGYEVFVSKANTSTDFPIRYHQFFDDREMAPILIHNKYLKETKKQTILITRNENQDSFISKACISLDFNLIANPFILFNKIGLDKSLIVNYLTKTNWLFFGSKNIVDFFMELEISIPNHIKIASIGSGTGARIKEYGFTVDFQGDGNNTEEIGLDFAKLLGNQIVLFPIGKKSLRSIQTQLPKENILEVEIYDTLSKPQKINSYLDILVFTSPSNVKGYFELNEILETQKVIAIGNSTAKKLHEFGIYEPVICRNSDDLSISEALFHVR